MNRAAKGIVMEVEKKYAVIMTGEGEFLKVKKPSHSFEIGDEIASVIYEKSNLFKYASIAAAILIMLIPFIYYKQAYATVAYVNVDINPSLELGINKYNKVNEIIPLNDDGKKLSGDISLKGKDIQEAVSDVIHKAEDMGYITDSKDNNVEIALVRINPSKVNITEKNLIETAKSTLTESKVDATIEVKNANTNERSAAQKENMSTNKYLDKTNKNDNSIKAEVRKNPGNGNTNKDGQKATTNPNNNNWTGKKDNGKASTSKQDYKNSHKEHDNNRRDNGK